MLQLEQTFQAGPVYSVHQSLGQKDTMAFMPENNSALVALTPGAIYSGRFGIVRLHDPTDYTAPAAALVAAAQRDIDSGADIPADLLAHKGPDVKDSEKAALMALNMMRPVKVRYKWWKGDDPGFLERPDTMIDQTYEYVIDAPERIEVPAGDAVQDISSDGQISWIMPKQDFKCESEYRFKFTQDKVIFDNPSMDKDHPQIVEATLIYRDGHEQKTQSAECFIWDKKQNPELEDYYISDSQDDILLWNQPEDVGGGSYYADYFNSTLLVWSNDIAVLTLYMKRFSDIFKASGHPITVLPTREARLADVAVFMGTKGNYTDLNQSHPSVFIRNEPLNPYAQFHELLHCFGLLHQYPQAKSMMNYEYMPSINLDENFQILPLDAYNLEKTRPLRKVVH